MEVKIYSAPTCGYCHLAKRFLQEKGITYREYDVSIDPNAAREMIELTGQMGVPVIVVDNEVIIGFDKARLEQLLSKSDGNITLGISVADAVNIALKGLAGSLSGAYVGKVAVGSIGERLGLMPGDIIIEFNLRPIYDADDLQEAISKVKKGDKVVITYIRGGNSLSSEITI